MEATADPAITASLWGKVFTESIFDGRFLVQNDHDSGPCSLVMAFSPNMYINILYNDMIHIFDIYLIT